MSASGESQKKLPVWEQEYLRRLREYSQEFRSCGLDASSGVLHSRVSEVENNWNNKHSQISGSDNSAKGIDFKEICRRAAKASLTKYQRLFTEKEKAGFEKRISDTSTSTSNEKQDYYKLYGDRQEILNRAFRRLRNRKGFGSEFGSLAPQGNKSLRARMIYGHYNDDHITGSLMRKAAETDDMWAEDFQQLYKELMLLEKLFPSEIKPAKKSRRR